MVMASTMPASTSAPMPANTATGGFLRGATAIGALASERELPAAGGGATGGPAGVAAGAGAGVGPGVGTGVGTAGATATFVGCTGIDGVRVYSWSTQSDGRRAALPGSVPTW